MLEKFINSEQSIYRISRHLVFWLFFWFYFGMKTGIVAEMVPFFLKRSIVFILLTIPLIYILIYYVFPKYLIKKKYGKFVFLFIVLMFIDLFIRLYYYYNIEPNIFKGRFPLPLDQLLADQKYLILVNYTFVAFSRFTLIAMTAILIKILKYWNSSTLKNKELERMNVDNKVKLLRSQIHPHFLFNTLNNLYSLSVHGSEKVPEIIIKISDILRYILKEHNKEIVNLRDELDIINTYIDLEVLRYGSEFNIKINNQVKDVYHIIIHVPPLVLFNFVENAFKHGPGKSMNKSWIKIDINYKYGVFTFVVENSKDKDLIPNTTNNTGLGLKNARDTLDLFFSERYTLNITDKPDLYKTVLTINYKN